MNTRTTVVLAALLLIANANAKILLADDIPPRPMAFAVPSLDSKPLHIASRRELFVDNVSFAPYAAGPPANFLK